MAYRFGPDADLYFADVGLAQQKHAHPRLPDAVKYHHGRGDFGEVQPAVELIGKGFLHERKGLFGFEQAGHYGRGNGGLGSLHGVKRGWCEKNIRFEVRNPVDWTMRCHLLGGEFSLSSEVVLPRRLPQMAEILLII